MTLDRGHSLRGLRKVLFGSRRCQEGLCLNTERRAMCHPVLCSPLSSLSYTKGVCFSISITRHWHWSPWSWTCEWPCSIQNMSRHEFPSIHLCLFYDSQFLPLTAIDHTAAFSPHWWAPQSQTPRLTFLSSPLSFCLREPAYPSSTAIRSTSGH